MHSWQLRAEGAQTQRHDLSNHSALGRLVDRPHSHTHTAARYDHASCIRILTSANHSLNKAGYTWQVREMRTRSETKIRNGPTLQRMP